MRAPGPARARAPLRHLHLRSPPARRAARYRSSLLHNPQCNNPSRVVLAPQPAGTSAACEKRLGSPEMFTACLRVRSAVRSKAIQGLNCGACGAFTVTAGTSALLCSAYTLSRLPRLHARLTACKYTFFPIPARTAHKRGNNRASSSSWALSPAFEDDGSESCEKRIHKCIINSRPRTAPQIQTPIKTRDSKRATTHSLSTRFLSSRGWYVLVVRTTQ